MNRIDLYRFIRFIYAIFNKSDKSADLFNPKSENFLGGSGMRQAILFFLAVAILLVVSGGKPVKATAKAVKEAL